MIELINNQKWQLNQGGKTKCKSKSKIKSKSKSKSKSKRPRLDTPNEINFKGRYSKTK